MKLFTDRVPANKNYVTGTVPANKSFITGTVKKDKIPEHFYKVTNPRVVRMPQYKNFVKSFRKSARAASIVELYIGLLNHSTAGLSWLNIRFFLT